MSRFFLDELRSKAPIKKCNAPLQRQKIVWLAATFLCVAPLSWKIGPPLPHCWYVYVSGCLHVFVHGCKQKSKNFETALFVSIHWTLHIYTTQQFQAITATTEWNSNADGFVLRTFNDRRVVLKTIYILN